MGEVILVYGKSGAGKSRSVTTFGEDEIFLVNVIGKRMPTPKHFKYELKTDDINLIADKLSKMPTKVAVIDDGGYIQTNAFMAGHGKGDQFQLYNNIADSMWNLFRFVKNNLPEDVFVYFMMHEDVDDYGNSKLRTIGKLLEQKVCLEGMVTITLHAMVKGGEHIFVTQSDGYDIAKSPEGMFPKEIPNDLKAVDMTIREYWGLPSLEETKGKEKK